MKNALVCFLTVMAFALSGCTTLTGANVNENRMEYISANSAKETALSDSGIKEADVRNISTELKSKGGRDYYAVDFETDSEDVSYDVDALTGAVLGSKHEKKDSPYSFNEQPSEQSQSQPQNSTESQPQAQEQPNKLTPAQPQTQTPTQSANETPQQKSDAYTANKSANDKPANQPQLTPVTGNMLSEARAKELVLARIPGATNANFVEFHKDYDDGRMEYEGKVIYQNMEYEFEIDAYSGAFRDWDIEFAYD